MKNGIADNTSKMIGYLDSTDTPPSHPQSRTTAGLSLQWVFVSANPPPIVYPSPATTAITNTTATNDGHIFNHYTAGNIYFDSATTPAYGTTTGPTL